MSERRKINEDRAKRDPSYVYFEELRIFLPFLAINFGSEFLIQFQYFFAMEIQIISWKVEGVRNFE